MIGLVLSCDVGAANVADIKAAPVLLVSVLERYERIEKVLADQGYQGELAQKLQKAYHCQLEITKSETKGFVPEKFRWLVERTFAWLENARALSRDYEQLPENHEGMIYVVLIRLMLRRLTKNQRTRKRQDA